MAEVELQENVIHINRVAKVVKGGRNFAFTALVAVGDGNGNAGIGYGKGSEVPLAIQKAIENAKKNIHPIPMAGSTLPRRSCHVSCHVCRHAHLHFHMNQA